MFNLSNDKFQVIFIDGSQSIFDPIKNMIIIKSKEGKTNFFEEIEDAISSEDS